jgi:Predicted membrane protein
MWTRELLGTNVYNIIHYFFIYSILGWLIESIYMSFCEKKIVNRGFIKGPICPIYGIGALTVFFVLRRFSGNYVLLFFVGSILATTIEFVTAKVMIAIFGEVWWDYNEKPFNYKGILCLESSVAWGFYTVGLFLFLQKFVEFLVNSYSIKVGKTLGIIVITYFIIDFIYHLYKAKADEMPKQITRITKAIRRKIS